MRYRFTFMLLVPAIIAGGIGINAAFAQEGEIEELSHGHFLAFFSFILAGLFYSGAGWAKKLRTRLTDGSTEPFEIRKLGKAVALGVFLGIAAFVWTAYEGETIHVANLDELLPQIGVNVAFIFTIDKLILGQAGKQPKNPELNTIEPLDGDEPPERRV